MNIGILQMELRIGDALNPREKRKIVRGLRDKWHHHHNVSVAEIGDLDHPQQAIMGVALVGNDAQHMESTLSKLVEHVRHERRAELLDFRIEIISGRD
jgi:uncharacterized protein YlxP (DUF503 family)